MIIQEIAVPEDVEAEVKHNEVVVRYQGKENRRQFKAKHVSIEKDGSSIKVFTKSVKKGDGAIVGTISGHIKNMIKGLKEGVTYKMKAVYSHFPMTIKVEGDKLSVDNFLGEKTPRRLPIKQGVEVKVEGQDITITGINKEHVSQTAAHIEQLCSVNRLDRRVFQDGIYIVEKDGKPLIK